jgi:two-component system KDP operon response regulator KdpE
MKVVIIEDEEDLGILIQNFLKKTLLTEACDNVVIARNLGDGLEAVSQTNPDWIILDNNLPDGKAVNVLHDIKLKASKAKIVMMSALSNFRSEALHKGADYFLAKPVSFSEILEIFYKRNLAHNS